MSVVKDPYLFGTVKCEEDSISTQFIYNNDFTVLQGEEYFINGEVRFPEEPVVRREKGQVRADATYITRFGPCVEHNGMIYEESNHNVRLAVRRITGVRKGDVKLDHRLKVNQELFLIKNQWFVEHMKGLYAGVMSEYTTMLQEALDHHADPHDKKDLRVEGWEGELDTGRTAMKIWMRKAIYKMKKGEWGKWGKIPRMICDMKVAASLQGFVVTKLLKKAQAMNTIHIGGGEIFFCAKPSFHDLSYIFENLLSPKGTFFFCYFSDDSCYAVHQPDGSVLRANVDISKCDASHGPGIFRALCEVVDGEARETMLCLVEQCKTPLTVYDLADSQRKRKVVLEPKVPKLYSGSTATTCINNLANIFIALSIAQKGANTVDQIISAAADAGYIVTVDVCHTFEQVQFLKHSPCLDKAGVWRPVLNLGVLLRLTGVAKFDLPGRGDLKPRAAAFQAALLQGAYPRSHFPLIDAMRKRVEVDVPRKISEKMKSHIDAKVSQKLAYKTMDADLTCYFSSADVYRRYQLTEFEMNELDTEFATHGFGYFHSSTGASKILSLDYSLKCV